MSCPHTTEQASPLQPTQTNSQGGASTDDAVFNLKAIMARMEQIEELVHEREQKKEFEDIIRKQIQKENNVDEEEEAGEQAVWEKKFEDLQRTLAEERQVIVDLRAHYPNQDLPDMGAAADKVLEVMSPCPQGTAGSDFSIQVVMGLAGSEKKNAKYQALLCSLCDLVLNACLDWELPWGQISASEKAKLYQVAHECHPILKRYINDWATIKIVKCYMKNKHAHHYSNGWLEVPVKYHHLKENSHKHDPNGSRIKQAKLVIAAKKKGKSRKIVAACSKKANTMAMDVDKDKDEGELEDENIYVE